MLSVDQKWIRPLPMDTPTIIPDTSGVQVTLIEANHCPGSCLFLFEGQQTVNAGDSAFRSTFVGSSRVFRYLHCGDFRASPKHVTHPVMKGKKIDCVYLDTTYLDSRVSELDVVCLRRSDENMGISIHFLHNHLLYLLVQNSLAVLWRASPPL
jgi:Cft2 family RNA processing exonuclease